MNETIQHSLTYKKYVIDDNLRYFKPHSTKIEKTFADEIFSSLNRDSKYINPKFFYDKRGSSLWFVDLDHPPSDRWRGGSPLRSWTNSSAGVLEHAG